MNIQFIGHAGFLVRSGTDLLAIDPWLSAAGAFDSAWFQLPCNHEFFGPVATAIRESDNPAVFVSHEHKDHFDSGFLRAIVHRQPAVFIAEFASKRLRGELRALGFENIVEVRDSTDVRHGSLTLHVFVDDNAINKDSAIRVSDGSATFLNLNDCKIFDRLALIRRDLGPVDIFTCQFSGATWHPTCYQYDQEIYRQISRRKQLSKFRAVLEGIRKLALRRYLPSAGPACFLDDELIDKNFEPENIFPRQDRVLAFLRPKLRDVALDPVWPGDVLDAQSNLFVERHSERLEESDFGDYIRSYRKRVECILARLPRQKSQDECETIFETLVEELRCKFTRFATPQPIRATIVFSLHELSSRYILMDLSNRHFTIADRRPNDHFYHLAAPAWQVERVLGGHMSWEDFSLTFRARLERKPDLYDTLINGFFFCEAEDIPNMIEAIERIRCSTARITIDTPGGLYAIDRYCPHQGADLTFGWYEDGDWICPRHGWRFSLANGGLSSGVQGSIHACPKTPAG